MLSNDKKLNTKANYLSCCRDCSYLMLDEDYRDQTGKIKWLCDHSDSQVENISPNSKPDGCPINGAWADS